MLPHISNQAALDIGICIVDNFNKELLEMTKHAFPAYTHRKQKRYLRRYLVKPRSMKLEKIFSSCQENPRETQEKEKGRLQL